MKDTIEFIVIILILILSISSVIWGDIIKDYFTNPIKTIGNRLILLRDLTVIKVKYRESKRAIGVNIYKKRDRLALPYSANKYFLNGREQVSVNNTYLFNEVEFEFTDKFMYLEDISDIEYLVLEGERIDLGKSVSKEIIRIISIGILIIGIVILYFI